MFAIAEKYEQIKIALSEILQALDKLSKLSEIEVNGLKYRLEFFVGSDLKFLAILYGINGANSHRPCIWCYCHKTKFAKYELIWSITKTKHGARTLSKARIFSKRNGKLSKTTTSIKKSRDKLSLRQKTSIKKKSELEKNSGNKFGHKNEPLIDFVDFPNVVVDLLHLLIRVTGRLMELLINDLIVIDKNDSQDLEKRPAFKEFVNFLENTLKFSNPTYNETLKGGKKIIKFRSFNGNERLAMVKEFNLNLNNIDSINEEKIKKIKFIWNSFYELFQAVSYYHIQPNFALTSFDGNKLFFPKQQIGTKLRLWLKFFLTVYQSKSVTPYMHIFSIHVAEMLLLHNDISSFNGQGIEALNKKVLRSYHCSTNKHVKNKSWLKQTLDNRSRKEFFFLNGWEKELDNNYASYTIDELDFGYQEFNCELVDIDNNQLQEVIKRIDTEENLINMPTII